MRVLVTGATGRIGVRLVNALAGKGVELVLLVRDKKTVHGVFGEKNFGKIVEVDLSNANNEVLAKACEGVDVVVHLAALIDYKASKEKVFAVNVEGTRKIVEAAKKKGVKRFVFVSSTSVWRKARGEINEETRVCPTNAYGESKLEAEEIVVESGLPFVILRFALVFGEGFNEGFGKVVELVKQGKARIIGGGENGIGLLHVDDAVKALLLSLDARKGLNNVFVVASGWVTQEEALNAVADALGVERVTKSVLKELAYLMVFVSEVKARVFNSKPAFSRENVETLCENRFFDSSKAVRLLGFKPVGDSGLREKIKAFAESCA